MSNVIPDYDNGDDSLPPTPLTDAQSVHDAFLGEPGNFTRNITADDGPGHVDGDPHLIAPGTETLSYLERGESMDYRTLSDKVPKYLRDQAQKIIDSGEDPGPRSMLAYAIDIFLIYGAAHLVGIEGCLELATELDQMLVFSRGRFYHYQKRNMDVSIVRIIADKIEEKRPHVCYTKEGDANMTVHDGCGKAVNITIHGNGDELLFEMHQRAMRSKAIN
jgi:hypothetical protein